jgi:hypothetical protein
VCLEMSGALSQARPCLLQASGGQRGQPAKQMWNGEEVVEVAEEELRAPQLLDATTPAAELHAGAAHDRLLDESQGTSGTVGGEEEEENEDIEKNWRRPRQDTDFAAHAGRVEKAALKRLNFNLLLHGREIGPSHGLDDKGMMTPDALRAIGIQKYQDLWCTQHAAGKVVEEAQKLLSENSSEASRQKVRGARGDLEDAVFYRQLDIMAYRFHSPRTPQWQEHKARLLARGKAEIVKEYERDWEDRERMRRREAVEEERRRELSSACKGHLDELDMRYNTMLELDILLK